MESTSETELQIVKNYIAQAKFSAALLCLEVLIRKNELSPYLLILKSRLILLQNQDSLYSLTDAENCLLQALSINPSDLEANEDLMYLYDAIIPNEKKLMAIANEILATTKTIQEKIHLVIANI